MVNKDYQNWVRVGDAVCRIHYCDTLFFFLSNVRNRYGVGNYRLYHVLSLQLMLYFLLPNYSFCRHPIGGFKGVKGAMPPQTWPQQVPGEDMWRL